MVQFLSTPVLSCAVINWLLSKCLTSAPNKRQTSDNKIDPLHFKKESFNWKISINGSVGFYRSKHTAVSALSLRAQAQWRLFEPNISCSMHPVGRNFLCNRLDISKAIQFWPRSERRLILCVFSLSSISTDTVKLKLSMKLTLLCLRPLFVACHFMNAWLLAKQQAIRILLNWEEEKNNSQKDQMKKSNAQNGLTPSTWLLMQLYAFGTKVPLVVFIQEFNLLFWRIITINMNKNCSAEDE